MFRAWIASFRAGCECLVYYVHSKVRLNSSTGPGFSQAGQRETRCGRKSLHIGMLKRHQGPGQIRDTVLGDGSQAVKVSTSKRTQGTERRGEKARAARMKRQTTKDFTNASDNVLGHLFLSADHRRTCMGQNSRLWPVDSDECIRIGELEPQRRESSVRASEQALVQGRTVGETHIFSPVLLEGDGVL